MLRMTNGGDQYQKSARI